MLYLISPQIFTAVKNGVSHLKGYKNMLCFYRPLVIRTDLPAVVHVARCLVSNHISFFAGMDPEKWSPFYCVKR